MYGAADIFRRINAVTINTKNTQVSLTESGECRVDCTAEESRVLMNLIEAENPLLCCTKIPSDNTMGVCFSVTNITATWLPAVFALANQLAAPNLDLEFPFTGTNEATRAAAAAGLLRPELNWQVSVKDDRIRVWGLYVPPLDVTLPMGPVLPPTKEADWLIAFRAFSKKYNDKLSNIGVRSGAKVYAAFQLRQKEDAEECFKYAQIRNGGFQWTFIPPVDPSTADAVYLIQLSQIL